MAFFVYLLFSTNLTGFSCFENDVGPSHDVYMNYCLYTITKPLTSGQKIRPIFSYFVNSLGFQYVWTVEEANRVECLDGEYILRGEIANFLGAWVRGHAPRENFTNFGCNSMTRYNAVSK